MQQSLMSAVHPSPKAKCSHYSVFQSVNKQQSIDTVGMYLLSSIVWPASEMLCWQQNTEQWLCNKQCQNERYIFITTCHFLSHLSSPSPRYYRDLCPHHYVFTVDFILIPAVILHLSSPLPRIYCCLHPHAALSAHSSNHSYLWRCSEYAMQSCQRQ